MKRIFSLSIVLAVAVFCTGCIPKIVKSMPNVKSQDDAVTRPALREYINKIREPVVVLRVPVSSGDVTREMQSDVDKFSAAYGEIERQLVRAGYTVRDRALLNRVLSENATVSYAEIKDRIQTDLIIELVRFEPTDMSNREYTVYNKKTGQDGAQKSNSLVVFQMRGVTIEARVVIVQTGAIGGIYTKTIAPCKPCFFKWDPANNFIYTCDTNGVHHQPLSSSYGVDYKIAAKQFADYLIGELRAR